MNDWSQFTTITAQQRREMHARARDEELARPKAPVCQSCWLPITDIHSRFLHQDCAAELHEDVYRTLIQKRALVNYDAEQQARKEVPADDDQ